MWIGSRRANGFITMAKNSLQQALSNPLWQSHKIGDQYTMDGKLDKWRRAYYSIFEDSKTGEEYEEPRALIEKPILGKNPILPNEIIGTDFREVPLRYLTKYEKK